PAALAERRKEQRMRELRLVNEALDDLRPDAFAAVREAMSRALGKRHYDVQMLGAMVLHRGQIAEMKTGEGKTFVAPLAAYLNGLTGRGVHVVTVNDYLAKRDAQWIGLVFHRLGMSVGSIQHDAAFVFDPTFPASDERLQDLRPVPRQDAYAADVTYGTDKMERWLGVDNMFDNDFSLARHLEQALKAEVLYKRDRDYVIKDGEVVIVDEFTGRLMPGRRWSEGLHQAIEAKEGVKIQSESQTLATITFQNYFRMYHKLSGMTGTAETEAEEFSKIYGLEVVVIPTNREM